MTVLNINRQIKPAAGAQTSLYTCGNPGTISSLIVCNQSAVASTFRITFRQLNAGLATTQYLYFDVPIAGNDTFIFTGGITCIATDQIYCSDVNGTCSFQLYGVEIS